MDDIQNEVIRFILPEMTEMEKAVTSRHFWTFLVTDSNLIIYRADSGLEVIGLGPGIFIASAVRNSKIKKKVGRTVGEAVPANRRRFVFSRQAGSIKLKTRKRGVVAKRKVIILTDDSGSVELTLNPKQMDLLKENCPQVEVVEEG